jgi:hypothetical protein
MRATAKKKSVSDPTVKPIDPLFVILDQHLCNFSDPDTDRKTFVLSIVNDYLNYLRKMNIIVPRSLEQPIVEELAHQVNTMLVKKIYGCYSVDDYRKSLAPPTKRRAKARYSKLVR